MSQPEAEIVKVLFVCAGNICRSPMAEAVFQDLVNRAGLSDRFVIDSAGTGAWHVGEKAHPGTLDVLKRHGIAYHGRARQLSRADLNHFDYVLAMDRSNLSAILRLAQGTSAQVKLFLDAANRAGTVRVDSVPDPYYTGEFDDVYDLVQRGAQALLDHLRAVHNL